VKSVSHTGMRRDRDTYNYPSLLTGIQKQDCKKRMNGLSALSSDNPKSYAKKKKPKYNILTVDSLFRVFVIK
jgi:hypothetical protein